MHLVDEGEKYMLRVEEEEDVPDTAVSCNHIPFQLKFFIFIMEQVV